MDELNDNEPPRSSHHTQIPRPHKKAPWACLQCRSRKVRCDVSQTGNPCTRCRRNGESCLEHPSDQRTIMRRRRRDALENNPALTDYVKILSPSHGAQPESNSANPTFSAEALPSNAANASSSQPHPTDSSDTSVFYLNYQFLSVGNLQILLSGDIDYLELQGCFLIPRREILDDFIDHYFLHVHPLLPLFNEADFWKMYSHRGSGDSTGPKISLLVFQAVMFASCNFTSTETIKALGFQGIRQAKASFYRKAKLLFDFETESSPIAIAQAALLLSYRPSYATLGIKRPNTTWLTLAVQNAEIADAKHYTHFQSNPLLTEEESQKQQNTLKRLWWCCIIRDRVLPLCVRRNIQIDRSRFNFAANPPLRYADVEDEIEHSRVYSPEAKRHIIRILEKFVELCVILTDVLALVYPLDERRHSGYATVSDTSKVWRAKNALREWEKDTALRLSDLLDTGEGSADSPGSQITSHESVTLYSHLVHIYYHSSWMALCHHEALGLAHDGSHVYNSMEDLNGAQERNQRELHNAASAVTNCLERLNRLQLDRWLPSSAVACTATPLVLHILDVKLSSLGPSSQSAESGLRVLQKHRRLKVLIDAMKTYHPQYDGVDFVVSAVRHIVDLVQLEGMQPVIGRATRNSFEWTDILSLNPNLYLRLALTIDLSLSKDRLAQELDFPPNLRGLFAGKLSPLRALIAGSPSRNLTTGSISDPSVISSTMEEWLKWGHRANHKSSGFGAKQGNSDQSFVVEINDDQPPTEIIMDEEEDGQIGGDEEIGEDVFDLGSLRTFDAEPLLDQDFNMEEFMGEMVDLAELDTASFVGDIIRAALS